MMSYHAHSSLSRSGGFLAGFPLCPPGYERGFRAERTFVPLPGARRRPKVFSGWGACAEQAEIIPTEPVWIMPAKGATRSTPNHP